MSNKNKDLVKYENSFIKRILKWFKNIFHKEPKEIIKNDNPVVKEKNDIENKNHESEKDKFFEWYNSVKDGRIDVNTLSYDELKRFNLMMDEEIDLKSQKLANITRENDMLENEIKMKQLEVEKLKAKQSSNTSDNQ